MVSVLAEHTAVLGELLEPIFELLEVGAMAVRPGDQQLTFCASGCRQLRE